MLFICWQNSSAVNSGSYRPISDAIYFRHEYAFAYSPKPSGTEIVKLNNCFSGSTKGSSCYGSILSSQTSSLPISCSISCSVPNISVIVRHYCKYCVLTITSCTHKSGYSRTLNEAIVYAKTSIVHQTMHGDKLPAICSTF